MICYIQYKSITYRNHFEWIDTLLPVKDVNLINHLDTMVMSTLNGEYRDSVWMAIPAVLDWNNQFTIHLGQRNYTSDDLLIDEVIEKVYDNRKDLTVSDLKSKRVKIKDAGGAKIGNWSYYDCLYGEVDYNNKFYILNEGKWYNVQDNYKQIILDYYDNAPYPTVNLIDSSKTETEADYNIKLAYSSPDFLLMDKKLVSTGVSHNSIEVCDVYSKNKILIHVKKGHSSSVLSHLFNQGFVSAELLAQLPFRRKFNEKINQVYPEKLDVDDWKVPEDHSFRTNEYSVVYGIITERDEARPHMPFFSKVAFRHFSQTLTNMGYHVYLGNIYAH